MLISQKIKATQKVHVVSMLSPLYKTQQDLHVFWTICAKLDTVSGNEMVIAMVTSYSIFGQIRLMRINLGLMITSGEAKLTNDRR